MPQTHAAQYLGLCGGRKCSSIERVFAAERWQLCVEIEFRWHVAVFGCKEPHVLHCHRQMWCTRHVSIQPIQTFNLIASHCLGFLFSFFVWSQRKLLHQPNEDGQNVWKTLSHLGRLHRCIATYTTGNYFLTFEVNSVNFNEYAFLWISDSSRWCNLSARGKDAKFFVIGKFHIFVRQQENNCEKTHWWLRACHRPLSQRQFLAHCILHCMRNVEANPRRTLTPNTFVRRYVCEAILFFLGLLNMEARKIGWTQSQAGRQQASRMHTPNNQSMKCTTYSAVYGVYVLRSHAISR